MHANFQRNSIPTKFVIKIQCVHPTFSHLCSAAKVFNLENVVNDVFDLDGILIYIAGTQFNQKIIPN